MSYENVSSNATQDSYCSNEQSYFPGEVVIVGAKYMHCIKHYKRVPLDFCYDEFH